MVNGIWGTIAVAFFKKVGWYFLRRTKLWDFVGVLDCWLLSCDFMVRVLFFCILFYCQKAWSFEDSWVIRNTWRRYLLFQTNWISRADWWWKIRNCKLKVRSKILKWRNSAFSNVVFKKRLSCLRDWWHND